MPRGAKDWGQYAEQDILAKTFDLGELAVRLGCPSVFSRSGSIIYATNFENGFKDWVVSSEYGCNIRLTAERGYHSSYSLVFDFYGGYGADGIIKRSIPFLLKSKYAYEIVFGMEQPLMDIYFTWKVIVESVSYLYGVYLRGTESPFTIEIPGAVPAVDTDIKLTGDPFHWNFLKLYVDTSSGHYLRLQLNNKVYNLKSFQCMESPIDASDCIELQISATNAQSGVNYFYVGSIIVTTNED